jgi:hypothetical protein
MRILSVAEALGSATEQEAEAIRQALDQYVENGHDCEADEIDVAGLRAAEAVLERLNGRIAALADADDCVYAR